MSRDILRGIVLGVLSDGSQDGVTRLLTSSSMESADAGRSDVKPGYPTGSALKNEAVIVSIIGRHQAAIGDGILMPADISTLVGNSLCSYADATPEPDANRRLERIMSSRHLSIAASATPTIPGSSLPLAGKILRRSGAVQDSIVEWAGRMVSHRSMADHAANIVIVQPGSISAPATRTSRLRGSVTAFARAAGGKGPWLPFRSMDTDGAESLGRVWSEAHSALRTNGFTERNSMDPMAFIINTPLADHQLSVVVPYDPITPVHVFWHVLSKMPQGFIPMQHLEPAALHAITAAHEIAHTISQDFIVPRGVGEQKTHLEECFADAAALMYWLQDGGSPEQARLFANTRHLNFCNRVSSHSTGICCDQAIIEGLRLHDAVKKGEQPLSPASLFKLAAKVANVSCIKNVILLERARGEYFSTAPFSTGLAVKLSSEGFDPTRGCTNPELRVYILAAVRALKTVWTPTAILKGNARRAVLVEENSLKNHIDYLKSRGMGHLVPRAEKVASAHAQQNLPGAGDMVVLSIKKISAGVEGLYARLTRPASVTLTNKLNAKLIKLHAKYAFDDNTHSVHSSMLLKSRLLAAQASIAFARLISQTRSGTHTVEQFPARVEPIQPFVVIRRHEQAAMRTFSDIGELYALDVIERLQKLREVFSTGHDAVAREDYAGFAKATSMMKRIAASIVSDMTSMMAVEHCLTTAPKGKMSGGALMISLVEDISTFPGLAGIEENWLELKHWANNGPMLSLQKELSSVLTDPVMLRVARHGMWSHGLACGERLDAEDLNLSKRDLTGRELSGCRLIRPNFTNCKLTNLQLQDALVEKPEFRDALCDGINIRNTVGLTPADFRRAAGSPFQTGKKAAPQSSASFPSWDSEQTYPGM